VVTYLSPINEEVYQKFISLGINDVYLSRQFVTYPAWVSWLRAARRNCTFLGITHNNWCRDSEFPSAVSDRLRNRVEIKVLFLDPTSHAAQLRATEDGPRDTVRTIRDSIKFMWDLRSGLEIEARERFKLYVYNSTPSSGTIWIDSFMVVTHYLAGVPNLTSPALLVKPVSTSTETPDLFGIYAHNLQQIEDRATQLTDANIANYI
jgi:hypothetical protein